MFRERKFRFNLWIVGSLCTVAVLVGVELILGRNPWHVPLWRDPLHALGLIAALGIVWAVVWTFYPVYVGRDGLRASDGIGRFHEVRWDAITKVSSLFGFYWIRHGKWGKALCIPKSLEDNSGFRQWIVDHAPEDNPLRQYLG